MGAGFILLPGKNHPRITPFGYCLVPLSSAILLGDTTVMPCQAMSDMQKEGEQFLFFKEHASSALSAWRELSHDV
jgi:hypothetical protein